MAENLEIQIEDKNPKFPKNLLLWLPKLPFNRKRSVEVAIQKKPNEKQSGGDDEKISKNNKAADVVKFSEPWQAVPPPLTLEADVSGTTSNKIILWQVYAIGGIFLVKWIWARWKERKEMGSKKESPDEDDCPLPSMTLNMYDSLVLFYGAVYIPNFRRYSRIKTEYLMLVC
ncbi:putative Aspartate/glutamate/uridylate kinase family protein [Hibiscus syriacus]|uniref:Aspartate/glutamate/uridylate kinase family protein n=1 Tax=Hibiscus syriacus TaxID=106335 RepID=A0A6A2YRP5_HIBSY|nr:uncharacterized protein LOC120157732 isoform X1 [Hibiscus syriacus]KAE8682029.1 putative Aspartate/glutamate/uridylate kinase family protein [Hibiscus syriacus]